MSARGRVPASSNARQSHGNAPGGPRHVELLHHPELLEAKIAAQAAEIKQLMGDNQRLASTHAVLREELAAAQQEAQSLRAHMRSVQTESDIQIRSLLDKTSRAEANIRAGEGVRSEVQQAIKEAQALVLSRQDLNAKIQEVAKELQKARDDIKSLPNLRSELDSLRKEHQRLRSSFENEKGSNIELVKQLKAMEQKLISMAKEVEKLQVGVLSTENRANVPKPYSSGYSNPDTVAYAGDYSRPRIPVNRSDSHGTGRVGPTSGVDTAPPNDGAVVATSTDTANPTSADAADDDPGSTGASASISDGDDLLDDEF